MSKKLQAIILALGFSVMIFGVGCASEEDDPTPVGPSAQERLVGLWDATNPEALTGGLGSVEFVFASDSTFALVITAITGPLDDTLAVVYTGSYLATGDGQMNLTDIELDGDPTEDTFEWAYSQFADDDSLDVTHDGISETPTEVTYVNVSPAN